MSDMKPCTHCGGRGKKRVAKTRTVTDFAMGAAMGAALGMGFFPSTKTETYYVDETCTWCNVYTLSASTEYRSK